MARELMNKQAFADKNVAKFLSNALKVFSLKQLIIDNQSLYESGHFGPGSGNLLNAAYNAALNEMRPQMIAYVECFKEPFEFVPSTIGNDYGDIYEM